MGFVVKSLKSFVVSVDLSNHIVSNTQGGSLKALVIQTPRGTLRRKESSKSTTTMTTNPKV